MAPYHGLSPALALGILNILNEILPANAGASGPTASAVDLKLAKDALEAANYRMLLEELDYDEKCLQVFLKKKSDFEVRMAHQRDEWCKKRIDKAKAATDKWWQAKAGE